MHRSVLAVLLLCSSALTAHAQSSDLENIRLIASRLIDVAASAETRDVDADEFARLKKNARILQFKRLQFYYKSPDKFRVDSRGRELVHISMIQNGDRKTYRTSLGLRRTQDVSDDPAKKQGPMDFGMLSAALWQDYHIQIIGEDTLETTPCVIVKMTLIEDPEYGYHKVWLDHKTFRIVRREKYTSEGNLKVRYLFREPVRDPAGVWYSNRIELYSPQGRFVGALVLSSVRINQGVQDSVFR